MNQIVITDVSVKVPSLPKYVQPIYEQLRKAPCYAFESMEDFMAYLEELDKWTKEINAVQEKNLITVHYDLHAQYQSASYGKFVIGRRKSTGSDILIQLNYLLLQGHIVVGLDKRTLRKFPFLINTGD